MKRQPPPAFSASMTEWTEWFYAEAERNNRSARRWQIFNIVWCTWWAIFWLAFAALSDHPWWVRAIDVAVAGLMIGIAIHSVRRWQATKERAERYEVMP